MAAEVEQVSVTFLEPLKTVHETRSEEIFGMIALQQPSTTSLTVAFSSSIRHRDPRQAHKQSPEVCYHRSIQSEETNVEHQHHQTCHSIRRQASIVQPFPSCMHSYTPTRGLDLAPRLRCKRTSDRLSSGPKHRNSMGRHQGHLRATCRC